MIIESFDDPNFAANCTSLLLHSSYCLLKKSFWVDQNIPDAPIALTPGDHRSAAAAAIVADYQSKAQAPADRIFTTRSTLGQYFYWFSRNVHTTPSTLGQPPRDGSEQWIDRRLLQFFFRPTIQQHASRVDQYVHVDAAGVVSH